MAMAGASTAGATSWSSDTAAAAQPLTASSAYSSWANNWNTAVVQSGDGNLAGPHAVHEGVTQSAVPSHTRYTHNWQQQSQQACNACTHGNVDLLGLANTSLSLTDSIVSMLTDLALEPHCHMQYSGLS